MSSAHVTSIDAVREFKALLILFCDQAKEALMSVEMESRRMLDWVGREQLAYWQRMIRVRQNELAQAKADLFRKKLPGIHGREPDVIEEKKAVRLAQMRLEEAEEKVEKCKEWARQLPRSIEEYTAPAHQLAGLVEGDLPVVVANLQKILGSLDAYTELMAPKGGRSAPAAPTAQAPAASGGEAKPEAGSAATPET
jgi:hypothetical protein